MQFSDPQVILFVADCERSARFYATFRFAKTFRSPQEEPVKIELALGGFSLGLALPGPAAKSHGITSVTTGHRAFLTLWTDDVDAAYALALAAARPTIAARTRSVTACSRWRSSKTPKATPSNSCNASVDH